MPEPIRVVVIDDHAVVRSGLANFLRVYPDLMLVGEGQSGSDALVLSATLEPDVILMDLVMPGMGGVEAIRQVRAQFPAIKVLVLTSFDDEALVQAALEAGAIGYLLKSVSIHEMANAIRAACSGQSTLSPEATTALIHSSRRKSAGYDLKDRELQILALLTEGLTNPQIADRLSLSISTVKFYVSSILEKLDVETRTEAVSLALQERIIDPSG